MRVFLFFFFILSCFLYNGGIFDGGGGEEEEGESCMEGKSSDLQLREVSECREGETGVMCPMQFFFPIPSDAFGAHNKSLLWTQGR